jgi:xylulose-5-phosphate/fructose-6-phosphate phosphoketolase
MATGQSLLEGHDPQTMHQKMAHAFDQAFAKSLAVRKKSQTRGLIGAALLAMIVLSHAKGWTVKYGGRYEKRGFWAFGTRCPSPWRSRSIWYF